MSSEGDRIRASLGVVDGKGAVRIEGRVETDPGRVWSALSEHGALAQWYGEVEGELRAGGSFHARLHASGWEGTRRVEACEPPRRLLVVPDDPDEADADSTEVTLTGDGGGTVIVVQQHGLPRDLLWAYGAGLQIHVEDLFAHLAGRGRVDARERFGELEPGYRDLAANAPER